MLMMQRTGAAIQKAADDLKKDTEDAKRLALPVLQRHGIVSLSDDTQAITLGDEVTLTGTGKDSAGRLHDVTIEFKVAKFGNKIQWQVEGTMIDGELVRK